MSERDDYADPDPPPPTEEGGDMKATVIWVLAVIAVVGSFIAAAFAWETFFPVKENR